MNVKKFKIDQIKRGFNQYIFLDETPLHKYFH